MSTGGERKAAKSLRGGAPRADEGCLQSTLITPHGDHGRRSLTEMLMSQSPYGVSPESGLTKGHSVPWPLPSQVVCAFHRLPARTQRAHVSHEGSLRAMAASFADAPRATPFHAPSHPPRASKGACLGLVLSVTSRLVTGRGGMLQSDLPFRVLVTVLYIPISCQLSIPDHSRPQLSTNAPSTVDARPLPISSEIASGCVNSGFCDADHET